MCRYPVKDHADSRLMQFIHEEHKVLRCTVSGGRGIITDHLIAPGSIQRMFHNRHQFHMGVSHFFYIVNDLRSDLTIVRIILSLVRRHKTSQIHFIHTDRSISALVAFPFFQEFAVIPRKISQVSDDGSCLRSLLRGVAVRVCFQISQSTFDLQFIFIAVSCFCAGNEQFENTGISQASHLVDPSVPSVEIPHYTDAHGVRCPDGKIGSTLSVQFHGMCAQFFINGVMNTDCKTIHIFLRDLGNMPVSIAADHSVGFTLFCLSIFHHIFIRCHLPGIYQGCEITFFVCLFHRDICQKSFAYLSCLLPVDRHLFCSREECLYQHFTSLLMRS